MSDLHKTFASANKSADRVPALLGNVILQPVEFLANTVKGQVLSGPCAGQNVEVAYGSGKGNRLNQAKFTNPKDKSFVDIEKGGTIRVEGITQGQDGVYNSRWMQTFNGQPKDGLSNRIDAVCNYVDLNRRDDQDRPKIMINILDIENENHVTSSLEDLESAIKAGFESHRAVMLFLMSNDKSSVIQHPFILGGQKVEDKYVNRDPAERAAEVMKNLEPIYDELKGVMAGSGVSIVPMKGYSVGPGTAEHVETQIKEATEAGRSVRIDSVDPNYWTSPTLGSRVLAALKSKEIPEEAGSKLAEAFKNNASKDEVAIFSSRGWGGVPNDVLRKFFADVGNVELPDHPNNGWPTLTLLESREKDWEQGFIIKAFKTRATAPYPAVTACAEARKTYYSEVKDAVSDTLENIRISAGARSEAPAADTVAKPIEKPAEIPSDDAVDQALTDAAETPYVG